MRLAYVTETYPPELNGVALTVERTVSYMRSRGHDLLLVRPRQPGEGPHDDAAEWRTPGLPIPMYADLRFGVASAGMLERRFVSFAPQLVHVATPGPLGRAALVAARRLGLAATADFRTNFHQYSRYYGLGWMEGVVRAYLRSVHDLAQRNFVPTAAMQAPLKAAGFRDLRVVGRGVDTERFSPAWRCASTRREWQAEAAPVLLYVGRLAAEKNVALALDAFDAVRRDLPAAQCVVVGDGPIRRALEQRHPHARFVGVQRGADLARHYASADLFLFPSLSDTFGNVVLEALASALPVVAFRTAAAAEHVTDGANGRLCEPGDDLQFIAATRELSARWKESAAARHAARAAALAATWEAVLAGFEAQLESTLHAHQTATVGLACTA